VTVVYLLSGTSWTVPSDWSGTNTIETIGGGRGGGGMEAPLIPAPVAAVAAMPR
jgi:hypothetical protein